MATALTGSIEGSYSAPATINVYFLDDGSDVGFLDQGSFTDAEGHTFLYDGWTLYETQQAQLAFAQFSAVANVAFNYVTDIALADFVMVTGDADDVGQLGYWNVGGGTITVNGTDYDVEGVGVFNWEGRGWDYEQFAGELEQGGFGFVTLLDNIARGLGVAFPHNTDGGSTVMNGVTAPTGDFGDFNLNQGIYTTMSLNDGWSTGQQGLTPSDSYGWQGTPMALDIAVLQEKYGANAVTNLGNTVYVLPDVAATGTYYQAIWDAGGTDTIRYDGNGHATIDLRPATLQYETGGGGFVSFVAGIHGGFTIANGVIIENAIGGAGNDTLIGNAANNILTGGPGGDLLNGRGGTDTANYSSAAAAVVADLAFAGSNQGEALGDTYLSIENLQGSPFDDILSGDAGANVLLGSDGNDELIGRAGIDTLRGGAGNDVLNGGPGGDLLDGGTGSDTATYAGAAAGVVADLRTPSNNQGEAAGDSYVSIENLEGSSHDDRLTGNAAANILRGGSGNDTLVGGPGGDVLDGGTGSDTASYASAATGVVADLGNASSNQGEAAGDSYIGIEHLDGSVFADLLAGNGGNNVLFGDAGADELFGRDGNDTLRGGDGDDALVGGGGDDRLFGGIGEDAMFGNGGADLLRGGGDNDQLRGGAGNDRHFGGGGDDAIFGGGGNDELRGGGGDDVLRGGPGDDRAFGGPGADRLIGGGGNDALRGGGGNDAIRGGSGNDRLFGSAGDDRLLGGGGGDTLFGGAGNDTLIGEAGNDRLIGGGGQDAFVFQPGGDDDTVVDFQDDFDVLDFRAFGFGSAADVLGLAAQAGADVIFDLPDGGSVRLIDFDLGQFGSDDVLI